MSLVASVAFVVVGHAAVLTAGSIHRPDGQAHRPTVMHLQIASAIGATPSHHAAPAPEATSVQETAESTAPAEVAEAEPTAPVRAASAQAEQSTVDGAQEYVPRPLLTVAPVALTPIAIEFPAEVRDEGRFVTVLSLFIDDEGFVDHVRAEGAPIPPALEAAARSAFAGARFSPGQLDGVVVRSLVHVEVVFDNRPKSSIDVAGREQQ